MRDSGIQMVDGGDDLMGSANPNRKDGDDGGEWASSIDAAIGTLSLDGGGAAAERNPEKRLKAVSTTVCWYSKQERGRATGGSNKSSYKGQYGWTPMREGKVDYGCINSPTTSGVVSLRDVDDCRAWPVAYFSGGVNRPPVGTRSRHDDGG